MIASSSDSQLGGRNIDSILAEHFCKEFQSRYNIDPHTNPRAYVRLLGEVEKLKKQMSANSTTLPLNIECFMDEKDVHGEMKRADMEAMCAHLFKRVESTLRQCLEDSSMFYSFYTYIVTCNLDLHKIYFSFSYILICNYFCRIEVRRYSFN